MGNWLLIAISVTFVASFFLSVVFWALFREEKYLFLKYWALGLSCESLRYFFMFLYVLNDINFPLHQLFAFLSSIASAYFIGWGTLVFIGRKKSFLYNIVAIVCVVWTTMAIMMNMPFVIRTLPLFLVLGMAFTGTGFAILKAQSISGYGKYLAGWSLFFLGLNKFNYPFLRNIKWYAPLGYSLTSFFIFSSSVGIIIMFYHNMRERLVNEARAHNQTEKDLEMTKLNYQEIFDATSEAIFIHDYQTGTVLDVNNAMLEMYGLSYEEAINSTVEQTSANITPYNTSKAVEMMNKAVTEGPQLFEWLAKHSSGDVFWVEVSLRKIAVGNNIKVLAVVRNIDKRKKSEEVLVRTEKMITLGGLAAGMAHEINNPLSVIVQGSQLMKLQFQELIKRRPELKTVLVSEFSTDKSLLDNIDLVINAGTRVSRIVKRMLGFSREGGKSFSNNNFSMIIDESINLALCDYNLNDMYGFSSIEIEKQYEAESPEVRCDKGEIEQVVFNILKNGAHAMYEKHGNAELCKFTITVKTELGFVAAYITDNGSGMTDDIKRKIFEPFFTTKKAGVGTGLGMSVSYFIINERHKGSLTVDSVLGESTTFIIKLPIYIKEPESDESLYKN